jgi:hypothetical protein
MMVTRIYYVPRNRVGHHIMNVVIERVGCSVGDFKINRQSDTIRFVVTCRAQDVPKVERILKMYDVM